VPLGTSVLQYAEENDWDEWEPATAIDAGVAAYEYGRGLVSSLTGAASGEAKGAAGDAKAAAQAASVKAQASVDTAVAKATAAKDTVVAKASAAKDTVVAKTAAAKDSVVAAKDTVVGKAVAAKDAAVEKAQALRTAAPGSMKDVKDRAKAPAQAAVDAAKAAEQAVKDTAVSVSDDVKALVAQAEAALAGKPYSEASDADVAPAAAPVVAANVYNTPLPLGFEPPPGYSRPAPPPKAAAAPPKTVEAAPAPPPLPLVTPAVAALAGSEPVIAQLAGTIDELASYLNAHPTAADKARDVLSTAQVDLEALAGRIDAVRKDEHAKLEASLEQQAGEYNSKLIELEIDAQTRLDAQEEGFRKGLDEQKAEIITAYRAKLERELETQSEIINER
jgi:mitofilin